MLPKKLILAFDAILYIAYNSRSETVGSREVADNMNLQQRYLEHILQHFVREGILKGVRGPRGGYRLNRERRLITLGDIMESFSRLEGNASDEAIGQSTRIGQIILKPVIDNTNERILQFLHGINLEDLCNRAESMGVGRESKNVFDYVI